MYPKIAVILAAYNGREFITEQVDSILSQVNVDVSVFISVDKSTDGTHGLLVDCYGGLDNVVISAQGRHFGSASANFFYLLSHVDFNSFDCVALSDQDDIWFPDKLASSYQSITKGFSGVSSDVLSFTGRYQKVRYLNKPVVQTKYDYFFESPGPGCTFLLSRSLVSELIRFLEKIDLSGFKVNHDWLIYAFARSRLYLWDILATPTLLYRQHDNNAFGSNVGLKSYLRRAGLLIDQWYLKQILSISESCDPIFYENLHSRIFLFTNCLSFRRSKILSIFVCVYLLVFLNK